MTHTVLLVEENVELLRSLARMLASEPYSVYTVRSAAEAVSLMKFHAVNAIVAGDELSVMSAVDLFAWVAVKYPESACVLLSGEGSVESVIRAVNDGGAFHIVARPCDAVQLAAAVRKSLAHADRLRARRGSARRPRSGRPTGGVSPRNWSYSAGRSAATWRSRCPRSPNRARRCWRSIPTCSI